MPPLRVASHASMAACGSVAAPSPIEAQRIKPKRSNARENVFTARIGPASVKRRKPAMVKAGASRRVQAWSRHPDPKRARVISLSPNPKTCPAQAGPMQSATESRMKAANTKPCVGSALAPDLYPLVNRPCASAGPPADRIAPPKGFPPKLAVRWQTMWAVVPAYFHYEHTTNTDRTDPEHTPPSFDYGKPPAGRPADSWSRPLFSPLQHPPQFGRQCFPKGGDIAHAEL